MIVSPSVSGVTMRIDKSPDDFPHYEEVFIIGKWVDTIYMRYLQAEAVVLLDASEWIFSY